MKICAQLSVFGVLLLALFGAWQLAANLIEFGRPVCDPGYAVLQVAERAGQVVVQLENAERRLVEARHDIDLLRAAWVAPSVAQRGDFLKQLSIQTGWIYEDLNSNAGFEQAIHYVDRLRIRADDDVSRLSQELYVLRHWRGK